MRRQDPWLARGEGAGHEAAHDLGGRRDDGAAQAATERTSLPVVGLFVAWLLIGYEALAHVMAVI
ncbi:hypothetical protein QOM21_33260 [Streptomyces sp. Pv4-95]|uniref:hypothetical protein n=1 Tax=Streptomyces sp. Pv4-95 TaxID=3049543 RepID=UPI00389226EE